MKRLFCLRAIVTLAIALAVPASVRAATYTKADNTNSLDQAVSWGGTAPTGTDIARWSGAYSGGPGTVVTNSLYATFDGSTTPSWGGISVGALSGSCLTQSPIFNTTTSVSNITAATEAVVNGFNVVTITCNASHRFENGEAVTISGVTPAGYNGTFIIAGVPAATQFTYTNATGSLAAAVPAGLTTATAAANMYIGGSGTGNDTLTIGSSGIAVASGAPGVVINDAATAFSGNQTWNLAAGTLVRFAFGGGAATGKAVTSGADGLIELTGGGVVSLNEGGASGFSDAAGFTGFTGNWQVDSGATLRGLRNGATAFGTGSITLNGGTLAVGGMSGDVGNWTWSTPITLAPSTTSHIDEQNVAGTGRFLKLNQVITGSGNVIFNDTAFAGSTFTTVDLGYILTGANNFSGTMTIGGPVENGIPGRLTFVRIGGSQATSTDVGTGTGIAGTLGTGNVVDNGVLTFLSSTAQAVPNLISGTGTLRIGSLNYASYAGAAFQSVTLSAANTYTGPTLVNSGTLAIGAGGSIANSSVITVYTNSTFDVSATGGFTTAPSQTLQILGGTVNGNLTLPTGSTNLLVPGGSNTVGGLTISGNLNLSGGSNTLVLDINNTPANDTLSVGGNLTASGVTTLQFVPPIGGLNAGTYTLITAAGMLTATPANFAIAGLAAGARPQTFSIAVSGNNVNLVVVGSPGNLTWVGDSVNNVWSTATTFSNWFNTVTSLKDIFVQNDQVTFDDSGAATPRINLTGVLTPSIVTVNGSQNYTFGGAGQIAGAASLTVNDSGTVTINGSNSFTGPVTVNYGSVAITNEAALGEPTNLQSAALTLDNGGALLITNTQTLGINTNRGIFIGAGGGTLIVSNGATLTVSNTVGDPAGSSILTKTGNGTLILSGNNNYGNGSSGSLDATVVNGGTVVYGNPAGLSRAGNTSGTSGFFAVPFGLNSGVVDINGMISYQPNFTNGSAASGTGVILYNGTVNVNGLASVPLVLQDSGATPSGWGSSAATVLHYNAGNNPGTLTIGARFAVVGTSGVSTRTFTVDDSAATGTEVNFTAPLGVVSVNGTNQDGRNITIIKNGAGTMQISAANTFPVMEVDAGTLRVNHVQALGADRTLSTNVSGGTGTPNLVVVTAGTVDLNGFSPAIGGLSDNAAATGLVVNNGASASALTLGASLSGTVFNASYSSVIADGTGAVSINKTGTNTQVLAGINTYSGLTIVNNGTLVINAPGEIGLGTAASTVTVAGGALGTLGGSGIINAPVIVQSGGTLAPGAGAATAVSLTLTTNLTLSGTNIMNVDKDTATNDLVILTAGKVNYGGTLTVATNLMVSTTLALGDSFQLFSAPAHTGNFASIAGSPGTGLGWSFNPANGVLTVVNGLATNPTNILFSVSGSTMALSWPADHLGWLLQSQTNALGTGLGTNWVDLPGSDSVTSTNLPVVVGNPSVFYRLRHP